MLSLRKVLVPKEQQVDASEYLMSIQASIDTCMVAIFAFAKTPTFYGSIKIAKLFYQPLIVSSIFNFKTMQQYQMVLIFLLPLSGAISLLRMRRISKKPISPENDSDGGEDRDYIQVNEHRSVSERTVGVDSDTVKRVNLIIAGKTLQSKPSTRFG